ncbi:MAG: nucleoside phosphorylase [Lachnospiraceae bacterium]|nr:nucleoside phosphorylase [Lachnospiraceae bacterium]
MKTVSAENPNFDGKVPHLMCRKGDVAEIVLLPGDPGRVKMFMDLCDDFRIVASNREYCVGTGTYKGVPVSVCSTGIGAPSTEIAVVELIELGAKALIRIGGTGVTRPEIKCGEMVINTAAMRMGGASQFYAPPEYPAVASFEVVRCLEDACERLGVRSWKGISASVGSFFAGQARPAVGKVFHDDDLLEKYERLRILNMEMEGETIMTLGSLLDVMTGCICAVHANRATDEWLVDFAEAHKLMCTVALEAAVQIKNDYIK